LGEDPEEYPPKKMGISNRRFYGNFISPLTGVPFSRKSDNAGQQE
jgi:hypothetical protein